MGGGGGGGLVVVVPSDYLVSTKRQFWLLLLLGLWLLLLLCRDNKNQMKAELGQPQSRLVLGSIKFGSNDTHGIGLRGQNFIGAFRYN